MLALKASQYPFGPPKALLIHDRRYPQPIANSQLPKFVSAGSEIYAQGEKCRDLYKVEFGAVRVYRLLADGRRQISAFHLAGEVFGFEADDKHRFFAEAICATRIQTLRPSPERDLAGDLLPMALKGLVRAQEHLLVLGRQNAIERLAAFLADMVARQGGLRNIELPMSRADIADYLGLTSETVSRVFSKLKQMGIIKLRSLRNIEISRWQALREIAARTNTLTRKFDTHWGVIPRPKSSASALVIADNVYNFAHTQRCVDLDQSALIVHSMEPSNPPRGPSKRARPDENIGWQ